MFTEKFEDLAPCAMIAELGGADEKQFQMDKLEFCYNFINDQNKQEQFGLEKLVPGQHEFGQARDGFWKVNEHQWIIVIQKNINY